MGDDTLRLVQITDLHLMPSPDQLFSEINTEASLLQVLDHIQHADRSNDLMLVTGDLLQQPDAEAYRRLHGILEAQQLPVRCLPGNHDDPTMMLELLRGPNVRCVDQLILKGWLIIFLNSYQPGTHGGMFSETALEALDHRLQQHPNLHTLVALHHQPVAIGSPWMDGMALSNPETLWRVLDRHPQLRGVIWGHTHQTYDQLRNGVRLMSPPSTCVQFKPLAEHYDRDDLTAGYRWLDLMVDGRVVSGVERLG